MSIALTMDGAMCRFSDFIINEKPIPLIISTKIVRLEVQEKLCALTKISIFLPIRRELPRRARPCAGGEALLRDPPGPRGHSPGFRGAGPRRDGPEGRVPDQRVFRLRRHVLLRAAGREGGGSGEPPANQTIEKYKTATLPNEPSREHYDFVGWYTQPTGGTYYNWSRPITGPVTLYARWKLKPLTYTVRYLEAGTNNSLAKEKVVTSPAFALNQTISEDALAITGYRPDSRVKDIQLNLVNNEIVFYYARKTADIKYTVKYVLANNPNIEVAPPVTKTVPGSTIRVKETAAKIDKQYFATQPNVTADMLAKDYYPVINLKTLTLSSNDANNVLVFEYKDFETAKIKVNYLDMDGNPLQGQQPTIAYRKKKSSYVVNRPNIAGHTYEKSLDNSRVANKQVYRIENTNDIVIDLYYKKNVVITAQNKTKVYDGQALKSSGLADITNDYTSYLEQGDTLTGLAFDGSQTDVGTVATSPKEAVFRAGNKNRNYFYKITYIPATLTVTPRPVVVYIEGEVKDKVYDGKAETIIK